MLASGRDDRSAPCEPLWYQYDQLDQFRQAAAPARRHRARIGAARRTVRRPALEPRAGGAGPVLLGRPLDQGGWPVVRATRGRRSAGQRPANDLPDAVLHRRRRRRADPGTGHAGRVVRRAGSQTASRRLDVHLCARGGDRHGRAAPRGTARGPEAGGRHDRRRGAADCHRDDPGNGGRV